MNKHNYLFIILKCLYKPSFKVLDTFDAKYFINRLVIILFVFSIFDQFNCYSFDIKIYRQSTFIIYIIYICKICILKYIYQ